MKYKENYMDDYDENPMLDNDLDELLPSNFDWYVERHAESDGKHIINIQGTDYEFSANESTNDLILLVEQAKADATGVRNKVYEDKRTGNYVTQFSILDSGHMELVE